jgi:hypothetical protein
MTAGEEIDALIAKHLDWRGARLMSIRKTILEVDPAIVETWKWMGSPVWERDGILCVGNIFTNKVSIVFMYGAFLADPDGLFTTQLGGNQRRGIDFFETDVPDVAAVQAIVRAAIDYNLAKKK